MKNWPESLCHRKYTNVSDFTTYSNGRFDAASCKVPPPSTDEKAWWESSGEVLSNDQYHLDLSVDLDSPDGVVQIAEIQKLDLYRKNNPFESPSVSPLSSSPSSSDEELYSHAVTLQTPLEPTQTTGRRPAPPPPRRPPKSLNS